MKVCGFYGCTNTYKTFSDLSFFKLPKNKQLRAIWVRHSGERDNKYMSLCEKHFNLSDIRASERRKQLKDFAVPRASSRSICSCTDGFIDPMCRLKDVVGNYISTDSFGGSYNDTSEKGMSLYFNILLK